MANSERRYEPTIDLQGFDLTMNVDAVHEPSRLPLVVLIALVVLAAFAGVVWLAYTQGVERGRESVSREAIAQQFWKPRKPAAPAYTGLKIYEPPSAVEQNPQKNAAAASKPKVATAAPALRPTASAAPDVPAAQVTALTGAVVSPAPPAGSKKLAEPSLKPDATAPEESLARVATHAPTQLTKPAVAPPVTTHPLTEPDALAPAPPVAKAPARPATKAPAPPAAKAPAPTAAKAPAPPVHKPAGAALPAPASVSAPIAASAHTAASGILLQIGSYKSDAEARASWQTFKSDHDAASGYQPDVKQVDLGAKGTWYRLRMGPFPDKSVALETCRKLKADGASCLLAQ